LERQVRVEGEIEKLTAEESDTYYNSRPKGSRLAATLSPQSQVIANRGVLEESLRQLEEQYADEEPPRPDSWGGYRVKPTVIEFWQGGPSRLHDRLRYALQEDGSWEIERLAP